MNKECIFCKLVSKKIPTDIILENDDLIVIKDLHPKASIHYLIIPKKHIKDIQSLEKEDLNLAKKIFEAAQELSKKIPGAEHFKLITNSGYNAGQRVFHLHTHFLAGKVLGEV